MGAAESVEQAADEQGIDVSEISGYRVMRVGRIDSKLSSMTLVNGST